MKTWTYSNFEVTFFLELSHTLSGLISDVSSTFSLSVNLFSGKPWQSFSLFSCHEHSGRAPRKPESDHWSPRSCRYLLQELWDGVGLEVWESLWGITEVQRRKIHTGKIQDYEGKFLGPPCLWNVDFLQRTILQFDPSLIVLYMGVNCH